MGSLSDTYENNVLDAVLGQGFAKPANVHVALFTVAPTDSTFGTEAAGGAYDRVDLVNDATNFPNAVNGQKSNGTDIVFPEATAGWGEIVAWAIMDDPALQASANIVTWGLLGTPKTVNTGETPRFLAGTLVLEAD